MKASELRKKDRKELEKQIVDFKKKPGSNSNFEEARTVYEGLETVIIRCSADLQETANPDTNRLYAIFCEFQIKVNSHVDKVRADHHIDISEEYQSSIIRGMLNILKYTKENPEDWLRRRGIALIHEAMAGGEHKGAKNALTEDYNALTYSFTAR